MASRLCTLVVHAGQQVVHAGQRASRGNRGRPQQVGFAPGRRVAAAAGGRARAGVCSIAAVQPPRVSAEVASCQPAAPGSWQVAWLLRNQGATTLRLESAWIPHGRFRGAGRLPLSGEVAPGTAAHIEARVAAAEAPGTIVENAFLIVRLLQQDGQAWRVFIRMRVLFDAQAAAQPIIEDITAQAVGAGYHDA